MAAAAAAGALLLSIGPAVAQTDDAQLSSDDGSAVSAAPAAPSIAVRVGYNGMAKIGNWLPVAVQVSNEGNSVAGELQIQVDDNQTGRRASFNLRPPSVYTVPATLPSHSRKQYQIDVFLPFPAKDLTVKLVTDQGNVVQQTGTLQALSGSEVLCGTLARNQDFFQQLKNLDLPGRQGKKPFVVPLTTQDIPSRQHAMSSLDCLIVNNISLTGLTDDQKSAILGWVEDGGLLVVGGGSGWQKTIQPLPKELMPVDVTGVKSIPSLQALADFAHQPIKGDGPWLVSTGKLQDGQVIAQQNGTPLLVGAKRGKGTVLYLAADPTGEPLATWNGNAALWKYVLAYNTTPLAVFAFFNPYGGFATVQNWGTPPRQAIFNVNDVAPPSTRWLLVFIGLYALAAGPLNYLLLRVVGLKGLGWLTIPVFIGVGAFATNHMAQQFRGSDLVLNKISLVRAEGSSGEANVRSYVSLYSPRKGDYTLLVPGNASVTGYARPFNAPTPADATGGNQWQLKVTENDTTNRVDMPLEASNTGSFLADSNVHYSGKIDSDLKVKDNTISGTVTNHTGQTMDDVVLAIGGDVYYAGHLKNGEKKNVDFTYSPSAPSAAPDPQKIKAALAASGKSGDTSRDNILDTFLGSNNSSQPAGLSGLTLLGWLDKSPLPVEVDGLHASVKESNLFVTPLALQFQRGADVVIPPALIETKQIGTFSTNFQRAGQYELNAAGSIALEFTLPVNAADMSANKLVLHMVGRYTGNPRFSRPAAPGTSLGQIYLYNWLTSDWDAQDFAWGDNALPDSGAYLSATNSLRVRYTYKPPAQQPTSSLQFSLDLTDEGQLR
ncbi:MAG TPA: hypothetical protein VK009_05615 [Chloroflexota bacterium]|nr:hypothetical protein [Chloroflexota bacterium]